MAKSPQGVRCGDTHYRIAEPVGVIAASLYLFMSVLSGMARHANRGFGFTSQGSRGANTGGHRGGC